MYANGGLASNGMQTKRSRASKTSSVLARFHHFRLLRESSREGPGRTLLKRRLAFSLHALCCEAGCTFSFDRVAAIVDKAFAQDLVEPLNSAQAAVSRPSTSEPDKNVTQAHVGLTLWQELRAKELLRASLRGGISLGELAAACGLSVRHFTRAFRQSTKTTPHTWLLHLRVEAAKWHLANSTKRLQEISRECGFADPSHFSRSFQRVVGVTPSGWRRALRT